MATEDDDEAKRKQRALKFGLGGSTGKEGLGLTRKVSIKQDEKLQARAIKFGLVSDSVLTKDEIEEKRKARAERFKVAAGSASSQADGDKKRAVRIARFINDSGRVVINTQEPNKRISQ